MINESGLKADLFSLPLGDLLAVLLDPLTLLRRWKRGSLHRVDQASVALNPEVIPRREAHVRLRAVAVGQRRVVAGPATHVVAAERHAVHPVVRSGEWMSGLRRGVLRRGLGLSHEAVGHVDPHLTAVVLELDEDGVGAEVSRVVEASSAAWRRARVAVDHPVGVLAEGFHLHSVLRRHLGDLQQREQHARLVIRVLFRDFSGRTKMDDAIFLVHLLFRFWDATIKKYNVHFCRNKKRESGCACVSVSASGGPSSS